MNCRHLIRAGVLCLAAFWAASITAHGLHMTTIAVTQRQGEHLILTIHTSPSELFNRMAYEGKPGSVIYLANGADEDISRFRQALITLLQEEMTLAVGQRPLQSIKMHMVAGEALRELLRRSIAEHVLHGAPGVAGSDERQSHLRIDIDGFVAAGDGPRVLEATFPSALGQLLVSYSRPQVQTLAPGERGSRYVQPLE